MNISTHAGLNLPQWPTSVEDIHICYLQYTIYNTSIYKSIYKTFKSFLIASYSTRDIPSCLNSSSSNLTNRVNAGAC